MSDLWRSREQAASSLGLNAPKAVDALYSCFDLVDDIARALFASDPTLGRVAAVTLAKARNLAHGCFSLCLDSIAQEAGALLRPLIESQELLVYLRGDPARVDEAVEDRLPSAGKIAKAIGGRHQEVRKYLNTHASHLSISHESAWHLLKIHPDRSAADLRLEQPFRLKTTLTNLQVLLAVLLMVAIEANFCLYDVDAVSAQALAMRLERLRDDGLQAFADAIVESQASFQV